MGFSEIDKNIAPYNTLIDSVRQDLIDIVFNPEVEVGFAFLSDTEFEFSFMSDDSLQMVSLNYTLDGQRINYYGTEDAPVLLYDSEKDQIEYCGFMITETIGPDSSLSINAAMAPSYVEQFYLIEQSTTEELGDMLAYYFFKDIYARQ